ncbi:MAG: ABC transporter ATP-binding protein [Lentisphaerae bacterium]|nr:ABC transporter ATP-binding protein [Lentisphaerota bacterium]
MKPILDIRDLHVVFDTPEGVVHAVDGVSLHLDAGETLGLVGESGCGKSVTAMSVLRLVPNPPGRIASGAIAFDGQDIATLPLDALRRIRGSAVGMVFQDPMTALSPLHKIGDQLVEAIRLHRPMTRRDALALAADGLARAGIEDPARCLGEYPFRLSGGQQQRVMIASVLMTNPRLIIADEPTTALDATVQAQVLELMRKAKGDETALLLITHNMGVVWNTCSRIAVMYAGEIVETGPVKEVFRDPRHPYTQALLDAMPANGRPGEPLAAIPGSVPSPLAFPAGCRFHPRCAFAVPACATAHPELAGAGGHAARCPVWAKDKPAEARIQNSESRIPSSNIPASSLPTPDSCLLTPDSCAAVRDGDVFLEARGLHKRFKGVHAVNDVSLRLRPGETLAIVGGSGCGKTTLARMLVGLETPSAGEIRLDGALVPARRPFAMRRDIQMIFQDPYSSLNPRMTIADIVTEAAIVHGLVKRRDRMAEAQRLLAQVGMPPEAAFRYPHEFSGGQRQRISIARAIALKPRIILCDEPVSALDVSVQAQVLNLLADLQRELRPAYLFITHDIGVVRRMAHRIAVMHAGAIVEEGPAAAILAAPAHPCTQALLAAEPGIRY